MRAVVDEIIVADTGSTDGSVGIARKAGAKVISIPWENDFAKARNRSLAEVTSDWVLMLDADERLDPGAATLLPSLLSHRATAGFQVIIRNYVSTLAHKIWDRPAKPNDSAWGPAQSYPAYVEHENVRLFRRDPEIYFTGRVHETVGWQILAAKRPIATSNLIIHHMGMVRDDEERARKILLYLELGRQKVADMPENSQAHFELGVSELENLGNIAGGAQILRTLLRIESAVWRRLVLHRRLPLPPGRSREGVGMLPPRRDRRTLHGLARGNCGRFALQPRALRRQPASAICAASRRVPPTRPQSKLGLAEARCGKAASGLRKLRQAIEQEPENPDLHDRLIMAELWLNHISRGRAGRREETRGRAAATGGFLRAASIRAKLEDFLQAVSLLRRGVELFPDSELLKAHLRRLETDCRSCQPFRCRKNTQLDARASLKIKAF